VKDFDEGIDSLYDVAKE